MAPDSRENLVHVVLGHSYLIYFVGVIFGAGLQAVLGYELTDTRLNGLGAALIVIGTIVMLWAQNTSRQTHEIRLGKDIVHDDFYRGPYRFTRSPTHLSLGLVVIGLAFVFNSLAMLTTAIITFLITRYVFIRKEEILLERKYGEPYLAYKKRVRY